MSANIFNSVKMTKPQKNVFDLSHDVKLSLNMGDLVPIMCMEAVPGDKFNINVESLLRFAPLVSPVMHRMDVTMHYFFVPNRILWDGWEKFITNSPANPNDPPGSILPAFPTLNVGNAGMYTKLCDYLGLPRPIAAQPDEIVSALPFAAYQKIWFEFYRDQNLDNIQITGSLADGDNSAEFTYWTTLQKRCWEHDYFTAALPFAQKGDSVELPLAGMTNVPIRINQATDTTLTGTPDSAIIEGQSIGTSAPGVGPGDLYAANDMITGGETTINDLRRAYRLQEWLEKAARGGSRYVENILSHFGVRSSDKRLQRPEYITGSKSPVVISEVLNTTGTVDAPQGQMAGHGVSVTAGHQGSYFCEEHGYIMGIMSVMPKTGYMQGIPKHFLKTTDPFQFYWPSFANIGEQEVLNRELFAFQGTTGADTFGYVPRYAEYKFENNRVAGDFRTSLDFWHLSRKFATPPALNETFVKCDPDHRIFAVTDPAIQKLYAHVYNKVRAVRAMPKFGTPTF